VRGHGGDLSVGARVDRCLDGPRLAVLDVAQQHRICTALRSSQPELGRVAEPVDVQLRAVVVRLGKPG
jgi:hypothetical protein